MEKLKTFLKGHKWLIFIFFIIIFAVIGYLVADKSNNDSVEVEYITSSVERGFLVSSVSGTGQVSSVDQVEIKPDGSGKIVGVSASNGQAVKAGALIARIDSRDQSVQVSEAVAQLEIAELELKELKELADDLIIMEAEHTLEASKESLKELYFDHQKEMKNAQDIVDNSDDDISSEYEDAYNHISNVFLDVPESLTGFNDFLYDTDICVSENKNFNNNVVTILNGISSSDFVNSNKLKILLDRAEDNYESVENNYDYIFNLYSDIRRDSDQVEIDKMLTQLKIFVRDMSDAIKSGINVIDSFVNYRNEEQLPQYSSLLDHKSSLETDMSILNNDLTSLILAENSIDNVKDLLLEATESLEEYQLKQPITVLQAERDLKEKQRKYDDLVKGPTEIELKSGELAVRQKRNSLWGAQNNLADYYIRAPFDGRLANFDIKKGETVSSSTVIATMIAPRMLAEITLNEIDAVVVEIGQKGNLFFDAIEGLSISGEVVDMDIIGTVNQGVVSYNVKVLLDVEDERVKPGMSVSVSIITEAKQDVLLVPLPAIKNQGEINYVEMLLDGVLTQKQVEIGLSNDVMIEIISGLKEGEEIISQTIQGTSTKDTTSSKTSFGAGGVDSMRAMRNFK